MIFSEKSADKKKGAMEAFVAKLATDLACKKRKSREGDIVNTAEKGFYLSQRLLESVEQSMKAGKNA